MPEYLELSISVDGKDADRVTEIFQAQGAYSVTIISSSNEVCFDVADPLEPDWEKQTLTGLFSTDCAVPELSELLHNKLGFAPDLEQKYLQDQDWESEWQKSFQPVYVGDYFRICPSWCEVEEDTGIDLIIDPGMAFGTGSHETTFLCLEALCDLNLAEKTVLDFGTGTGILGIAASKLGATNTFAIDIDCRAVTIARENAEINQVSDRFQAMSNDDFFSRPPANSPDFTYDIVIANILANTLNVLSVEIKNLVKENGRLLLSGILENQVPDVLARYQDDFDFTIRKKNDWILLIGQSISHQ